MTSNGNIHVFVLFFVLSHCFMSQCVVTRCNMFKKYIAKSAAICTQLNRNLTIHDHITNDTMSYKRVATVSALQPSQHHDPIDPQRIQAHVLKHQNLHYETFQKYRNS